MKGARCAFRPIGPMPGPPPPCGMQKVLCRFMWLTSAPMVAGEVRPTWAFMLAPSMYTWPPYWCTVAQISRIDFLEHAVGGRVGDHQRGQPCRRAVSALALRSATSTLPLSSQFTTTTSMPHIWAVAGLVPWADLGIRQILRLTPRRGRRGSADRHQAGVLALRARVGLHADGVKAGDLAAASRRGPRSSPGSRWPGRRRERVHVGELGPGDRESSRWWR
jgi:hypothetical protein